MSRILVTGGAGFIGSHLVQRLLVDGHDVVIVDNLCSGSRKNLTNAEEARLIVADILDLPDMATELRGIDLIFHFAALISSHDSLNEPDLYVRTNLTGTLKVIEAARSIGASRIVFASSSTVYGASSDPIKSESSRAEPITVYSLTKLAAEHLLAMYAPVHGYTHASLRLFNVYGPRQAPDHPYANVTCKFAHAMATATPVDVFGDGDQTRDFVYVDDVVEAFRLVAFSSQASVYNVGSGRSTSINHLLDIVERIGGTRLVRRNHPEWPNDIRAICADTQRIENEHNFTATISLADGIARTIQHFREVRLAK